VKHKTNIDDTSDTESNDSFHTATEYEIQVPVGYYLCFSKDNTPWIIPTVWVEWKYFIDKLKEKHGID